MKEETTPQTGNTLFHTYQYLSVLPKIFIELIREEMGWSEATFYRRMKTPKALSNAECTAILLVFEKVLTTRLNETTSKAISLTKPFN
ncbi:hypothetical protein [Chitinophaga barathri]|uniref:hypothetical protein n=1 Tax=Chitinophaga barathri TaxID=1647451 RepID=UPI000EA0BEF8|nr:hypothetical protein [Chitinophaga barathri]